MKASLLLVLVALLPSAAFSAPPIKGIKLAVENPSDSGRPAANIVVQVADLKRVAPDFTPGSFVVTATDAATIEQDAAVLQAQELPSQADDTNGDNKADEICFQIDLRPRQTRIVTVSYGPSDRIYRLRDDYRQRTAALYARKIEGVGWESERIAWRLYFDRRNAIDIYGKRRPTLQLRMHAAPDYVYHDESPEGRDIFRVGDALGVGAVGALVEGKAVRVSEVAERRWRVLSSGPVRSILELEYEAWSVGGRKVTLRSRITQWAGERGFTHRVNAPPDEATLLVTGLPVKQHAPAITSGKDAPVQWLATWGEQVVQTGSTQQDFVPGENLGLAVITRSGAGFAEDANNHLLRLQLGHDGAAEWYTLAAWDQEDSNHRIGYGNRVEQRERESYVLPPDAITTREAFLALIAAQAERLREPARVAVVSTSAAPQSAPPDTLKPAARRTYREAIELLRQEVDRTAGRFLPLLRSASPTYGKGPGFFTEGDNLSGEWKPREGYWWTGSFWTGELWRLYGFTRQDKYLGWAQQWAQPLLGQELTHNHDTGFLYYYGAVPAAELAGRSPLKQSALLAATRLQQWYNPQSRLIPAWVERGDDSIVDTMMNLQLLWWASRSGGSADLRELAMNHALRTAEWFIRPDGSVTQSVHYNPGDNRQEFSLHGGASRDALVRIPNHAAPGERIFSHTHQGFSADTSWARGAAWALHGFSVAYAETKDERMLRTAERVADFVLQNLPEDGVTWYDLDDQGVHFRNRDTSAAAIMAGGLLRLSEHEPDRDRGVRYRREAERIVQSLIDRYLTPVGAGDAAPPGLLRHGCSTRPQDGPLIYGQYYLLDALLWLAAHDTPAKVVGR